MISYLILDEKGCTNMCIYALKEIVCKYYSLKSTILICFLDYFKTFDKVNHTEMFTKLSQGGVTCYQIRILLLWYACQILIVS